MPPGIPVASMGINASLNAAVMAVRILALADEALAERYAQWQQTLRLKIRKANDDLALVKDFAFKTN